MQKRAPFSHKETRKKLKTAFESIFEKYGRDFEEESDIVDVISGQIIEDKGHLKGIQDDHTWVPNEKDGVEEGDGKSEISKWPEEQEKESLLEQAILHQFGTYGAQIIEYIHFLQADEVQIDAGITFTDGSKHKRGNVWDSGHPDGEPSKFPSPCWSPEPTTPIYTPLKPRRRASKNTPLSARSNRRASGLLLSIKLSDEEESHSTHSDEAAYSHEECTEERSAQNSFQNANKKQYASVMDRVNGSVNRHEKTKSAWGDNDSS